jgi:hypothetical protein
MDIEGSSFYSSRVRERGLVRGNSASLQRHSKVNQRPSRRLLPLFPIGNKSETAKKLLWLEVGREFELDERLFIVLAGRAMELLGTY